MNSSLGKSPQKSKVAGRKDKEALRQKHRRQLQQIKLQNQRKQAKAQISHLKQTGLVAAYEQFLRSICKNGLPQPNNIYELAAQYVLKYEKKQIQKNLKKQQLQKANYKDKDYASIDDTQSRSQSPTKKSRTSKQKPI